MIIFGDNDSNDSNVIDDDDYNIIYSISDSSNDNIDWIGMDN